MPRYQAKLFLEFDADSKQEARNSLELLMGDLAAALEVQEHTLGASIAEDDLREAYKPPADMEP